MEFKKIYFYFICLGVLSAYISVSVPHVCGAHGEQKSVLDPLKLEFQMILSSHVGAGIEPRFSRRAACALIAEHFLRP